ncbi:MAG TPA: hypothetical protein VFM88_22200 [Vicinamibacteria bacterium]|nr:hypothetical protein [Vicinamibacteria bacterium]
MKATIAAWLGAGPIGDRHLVGLEGTEVQVDLADLGLHVVEALRPSLPLEELHVDRPRLADPLAAEEDHDERLQDRGFERRVLAADEQERPGKGVDGLARGDGIQPVRSPVGPPEAVEHLGSFRPRGGGFLEEPDGFPEAACVEGRVCLREQVRASLDGSRSRRGRAAEEQHCDQEGIGGCRHASLRSGSEPMGGNDARSSPRGL